MFKTHHILYFNVKCSPAKSIYFYWNKITILINILENKYLNVFEILYINNVHIDIIIINANFSEISTADGNHPCWLWDKPNDFVRAMEITQLVQIKGYNDLLYLILAGDNPVPGHVLEQFILWHADLPSCCFRSFNRVPCFQMVPSFPRFSL